MRTSNSHLALSLLSSLSLPLSLLSLLSPLSLHPSPSQLLFLLLSLSHSLSQQHSPHSLSPLSPSPPLSLLIQSRCPSMRKRVSIFDGKSLEIGEEINAFPFPLRSD